MELFWTLGTLDCQAKHTKRVKGEKIQNDIAYAYKVSLVKSSII